MASGSRNGLTWFRIQGLKAHGDGDHHIHLRSTESTLLSESQSRHLPLPKPKVFFFFKVGFGVLRGILGQPLPSGTTTSYQGNLY